LIIQYLAFSCFANVPKLFPFNHTKLAILYF